MIKKDDNGKRKVSLPTIEEVEKYEEARKELLKILEYHIPSLKEYKEIFDKYKLNEIIPKVVGWIGICKNCFKPLRPEYIDINKLNIERCKKTKPNDPCYLFSRKSVRGKTIGIRCRDVKLNGKLCKNLYPKDVKLDVKLCKDLYSKRWHFLQDYLFKRDVRKNKKYCSDECRIQAQNKRKYIRSIHKGTS